jgi:voltage-gated potassium channel
MVIKKHHNFMWSFTKGMLTSFRRPVFIYLVSASFSIQLLGAICIYYAERNINTQFQSFFDALYYTVTIVTGVGLGDLYPVTVIGRLLTMIMMLLGTGLFVSFTAVLAATILEVELAHKNIFNKS